MKPMTYEEVLGDCEPLPHLLLGNGFSIACDPVFRYQSLYEEAVARGLSEQARKVFEYRQTTNFEAIMRLLDEAEKIVEIYDYQPRQGDKQTTIRKDCDFVKDALVKTIAATHLRTPDEIGGERIDAAAQFLRDFDNVFTTNYDLLLEWVLRHSKTPPLHDDSFRASNPDDGTDAMFMPQLEPRHAVFYVHGALHLYFQRYDTRKQDWSSAGQSVDALVERGVRDNKYPLCVTEGSSSQKVRRIRRNVYLAHGLAKLRGIRKPLVVFGHRLSDEDKHIRHAIAENSGIKVLYVGLHNDPDSKRNLMIREAANRIKDMREERMGGRNPDGLLTLKFFSSQTAEPWTPKPPKA